MENKYYQIGELASILNLSRQMIRYYEECGVITPIRISSNNYRLYSAMDYFALSEAIALSRFNINIKDIYQLKMTDYTRQVKKHFNEYIRETEKQIHHEEMMIKRARQLIEKTETASLNIDNIWIKKVPAHMLYPLMSSKDDTYGEVVTPKNVLAAANKGSNVAFGDGIIEFKEQDEFWWFSADEEYLSYLTLPDCKQARFIPEEYCLCTVKDMGEIGSFHADDIREFKKNPALSKYNLSDRLYGFLLARGEENGVFHRYLEIHIPLQPYNG